MEMCHSFEEIQHPAVRETLRFLKINEGLEIHHDGDLPARSGLGSSSSFTVGLLHALYAHKGIMPSKKQLAMESIHIEQNMIGETVGSQDQVCVAFGGLNKIDFSQTGEITVQPIVLTADRKHELNSHLMLFYTGIKRTASDVAKGYANSSDHNYKLLSNLKAMVYEGISILKSSAPIYEFGRLLHETWMLKKELSPKVSNAYVDSLYQRACEAGATGGKIIGAGGGGFLLLFAAPSEQKKVRKALTEKIYVPFHFDSHGSQIIFYEPEREDYKELEKDRAKRAIDSFAELDSIGKLNNIKDILANNHKNDEEYTVTAGPEIVQDAKLKSLKDD
jgi:D-glycero-alpha-D-manno-heptose-7-phosphate kinase